MTHHARSLLLALALVGGCECGEPSPSMRPAPAPAPVEVDEAAIVPGAVDPHTLAPASRTDLPAAGPALTVVVEDRHVVVTNEALIATWPPSERERLEAARPAEAPSGWPSLRTELELPDDQVANVPSLVEALRTAASIERTRSGHGAPVVFALRVTGASPWWSVMRTLFAASMAGLSEPRFVLASGREEVELRLPFPARGPDARRAERNAALLAQTIQRALAAQGLPEVTHPTGTPTGTPTLTPEAPTLAAPALERAAPTEPTPTEPTPDEPTPTELAPDEPATAHVRVRLTNEGLFVWRGDERLGPGCQRAAIGEGPSLPTATLTRASVRSCIASAGATTEPYWFEAADAIGFARVVPVLELLDDAGSVAFDYTPR